MHFWSPNKKATGGGGKRKEKKRKKKRGRRRSSQGMDACLCYEFYMDIRDPSMILIQEFLGYDC